MPWHSKLGAPSSRSYSVMCPDRGSRRLVFRVLRSSNQWCCATRCPTPRTLPLHRWCHRGLLSCSTEIPTPPTPQEVGGIQTLFSQSLNSLQLVTCKMLLLLDQNSNTLCVTVFSRPSGCCSVTWAFIPSTTWGPALHSSLCTPNHTPKSWSRGTRLGPGGCLHPALS